MPKIYSKEFENQIAQLYGCIPIKEISQRFGIDPLTVKRIAKRNSWKNIENYGFKPFQVWKLKSGLKVYSLPYRNGWLFFDINGNGYKRTELRSLVTDCNNLLEVVECLNGK
jgi:hypothetical protein